MAEDTRNPAAPEPVGFRTRVAAEKRDRMRARLLAATLEACGGAGGPGAVVIDDVVRAAGVSRGAFYRHFPSLEAALAVLVADLVGEIVQTVREVFSDVDDPVLNSAIGSQLLLYRAAMDPAWARFVSSTSLFLEAAPLLEVLRRAVGAGGASGAFRFDSLGTATDLFAGGLLAGVRRLRTPPEPAGDYISELSRFVLRGLGVPEPLAGEAAAAARARIEAIAPARLSWWRPA